MKEEIINLIMSKVDDEAMYNGEQIFPETFEGEAEFKEIWVQDVKESLKKFIDDENPTIEWICDIVNELNSKDSDEIKSALKTIGAI